MRNQNDISPKRPRLTRTAYTPPLPQKGNRIARREFVGACEGKYSVLQQAHHNAIRQKKTTLLSLSTASSHPNQRPHAGEEGWQRESFEASFVTVASHFLAVHILYQVFDTQQHNTACFFFLSGDPKRIPPSLVREKGEALGRTQRQHEGGGIVREGGKSSAEVNKPEGRSLRGRSEGLCLDLNET